MSAEGSWEEFEIKWAPVTGLHTQRDEDGEQKWKARCNRCGATIGPMTCLTGMIRQHVANFALDHTHRHPLEDPPKRSG